MLKLWELEGAVRRRGCEGISEVMKFAIGLWWGREEWVDTAKAEELRAWK